MTAVPSPDEVVARYGRRTPEELAMAMGFRIERRATASVLPGVTVLSEYQPERTIVLYADALCRQADSRREPLLRLEGWHIAHELYHGLAEHAGASPWRVRETEADLWAEALLTLLPVA